MARETQIVCISHLAQVSAGAKTHFLVKKSVNKEMTTTYVEEIQDVKRKEELARLMCGVVDDTTLQGTEVLFG